MTFMIRTSDNTNSPQEVSVETVGLLVQYFIHVNDHPNQQHQSVVISGMQL